MGDLGRLAVLVLAVLAAAASTTSNNPPPQYNQYPQQQYPQQPYPQQQPLPPAPQGAPQAQWTACDYACAQLARCNLSPYDACDQQCKAQRTEEDPNGARGLDEIARTDCPRLAQMMRDMQQPQQRQAPPQQPAPVSQPVVLPPSTSSQPAPPSSSGGGQRQWQCSASGSWQTCAASGFPCTPQFASAFAFGSNEALARSGAETQCNSNMSALVSASFASHARVVASCRATTCTPP